MIDKAIRLVLFLLFVAFFVYLGVLGLKTAANAQEMCGDCNGDHRVSVAELTTAVNNALDGDPCHEGCAEDCFTDQGNCPCDSCFEFPVVDGVLCTVSMCNDSREQVRACHARFRNEHPTQCFSVGGVR